MVKFLAEIFQHFFKKVYMHQTDTTKNLQKQKQHLVAHTVPSNK